jgi:hypothetical protein
MEKKIIILAGNREQFERYLDENGLTDSDAIYGYEPDRVCGIIASKVEVIGTFWEKKNANEIYKEALTRVR